MDFCIAEVPDQRSWWPALKLFDVRWALAQSRSDMNCWLVQRWRCLPDIFNVNQSVGGLWRELAA
jgi:hypothetical protein